MPRAIAPRLGDTVSEEITVAENQEQYRTITMARVHHVDGSHSMYARYTFSIEERRRIAAGEDVYVSFPEVTYPHNVSLRPDWAESE